MRSTLGRCAAALLCLGAVTAAVGCGKRGNPMPPLPRVPAAPTELAVTRIQDDVFVRVTIPSTNIDGARPADVAQVLVYAITLDRDQSVLGSLTPEELRERSTLVAAQDVRPPVPPPPPPRDGEPAASTPTPPPAPGLDQGAVVVLREALTPETHVVAALPESDARRDEVEALPTMSWPLGQPPADTVVLQRYYYAVAVSARGRHSPHTGLQPAPLGPTSGPPSQPVIDVTETAMTLKWTPPPDARGQSVPVEAEWLTARSLLPVPTATTYDVYEAARNASPDAPLAVPVPITDAPIGATELTRDHAGLGTERCFYVRPVDLLAGTAVRGPASPVGCAPFADVFAPAPARDLIAASIPGAINVIWESSPAKDVDGYIVLRGAAGDATLTALTTVPAGTMRYRDEAVQSGVRYVYAIVAVDKAGNRSEESNRAEETAR